MTDTLPAAGRRPLDGVRVLEMGQLIAGPFTTSVLGYFGAEVIKIEPPKGGDPLRVWRALADDGTSFWWRSMARNKKSVTLDLRSDEGRAIAKQLALKADVLVENFLPGRMEEWGLGPEDLKQENPKLVYARVSGYGQTGPNAQKPGYASVCEGFGGFRYVNGFPDRPAVRPNLSLGDTLASLHAVIGILLALVERGKVEGMGQVVDVAIYEAVFGVMEGVVPEFDGAGLVREPSGSTLTGIVPTNVYRAKDGQQVIIGGNGDSIFKRLMIAAGRPDMADDPRLENNAGRVEHEKDIDDALAAWTATLPAAAVIRILEEVRVPVGPIYSVRDMVVDPQYLARGMIETVEIDGKPLKIPAIGPRLADTPGRTDWPGPALGAHNDEVLGGLLGMNADVLSSLRAKGVV
ncbi:MAG: CaiB/BaiF CoA-transferase family protein [Proteobacteria bacterium]|nr:CaiB/BaiF CoA-transferase family protein [Pseudomonadota bacterium]MDA1059904.1 CaiB/BaiF CoA-transferase family protein [Pseudomonadota bacterium]